VSERSAVVVGAGIGGLAAAVALARVGWRVTLLERADRLRPGCAAVLLWPNGVRALGALGLGAGLHAIASPVPDSGLRRPDGRWLQPPGARGHAVGPVVIHRADLHDAFVAGLGDRVAVRTGVAVRTARPGADRPAVSDGRSTWWADLVVAADGADSVLRRRLAPASTLVSAGYAVWRAFIPWFRAPQLADGAPAGGETLGEGHRFMYASLGERGTAGASARGGVYWLAAVPGAARPEPPETQLALLRRWFAGWHAPIGDLLSATDPDELVQEPVRELRPLPPFTHPVGAGGYVLLGDAAHALSTHSDQAAGLALEDAATLRAALRGAVAGRPLRDRLEVYGRQRVARVARVATHGRRLDAALRSRRRFPIGPHIAPRLLERVAATAAEWQPPDA
jgi:2-polyprenyl-6-methoxyphenol hydroxylase-like FAD-dependent oxidoreductase